MMVKFEHAIVDIIPHLATLKRDLSVLQLAQILGCSDSQLYKAVDRALIVKLPAPTALYDCARSGRIGRAIIRSAAKVAR